MLWFSRLLSVTSDAAAGTARVMHGDIARNCKTGMHQHTGAVKTVPFDAVTQGMLLRPITEP